MRQVRSALTANTMSATHSPRTTHVCRQAAYRIKPPSPGRCNGSPKGWKLSPSTAAGTPGDWLAEAVTEFGLALLPWQGPQARISRSIWRSWYDDPALPQHRLFLAAVSVPDAGQDHLRDLLRRSPPAVTGKREQFLLLRLTAIAARSVVQGAAEFVPDGI
jgi:hypothetical protein